MVKAYSYIRMSLERQSMGDSHRRQKTLAEKYADKHGLDLDDGLEDIGVSAFTGKNKTQGALSIFLERVQTGHIERGSYLLVESFDRLSREDVLSALGLFTSIIGAGITIVTLGDDEVYNQETVGQDFTKLIISIVSMARSHEESVLKSTRLSSAWKKKREELHIKKMTGACPAWLTLAGNEFLADEDKLAVIKEMLDMTLTMGKDKITQILNDRGVKPIGRAETWNPSGVRHIVTNEALIGRFQPRQKIDGKYVPAGPPIENYFPVVIDPKYFYRVQKAMKDRNVGGAGRKGETFTNLFTGIARCGECFSVMAHQSKGKRNKSTYLQCNNAKRHAGCINNKAYNYERLEASVIAFLQELDSNDLSGSTAAVNLGVRQRIDDLKAELEANQTAMERLIDAFTNNSVEAVQNRIYEMDAKDKDLKSQIAELEKENQMTTADNATVQDRYQSLLQIFTKLVTAEGHDLYAYRSGINTLLKKLIDNMWFYSKDHMTVLRMVSNNTYFFENCHYVGLHPRENVVVQQPGEERPEWVKKLMLDQ